MIHNITAARPVMPTSVRAATTASAQPEAPQAPVSDRVQLQELAPLESPKKAIDTLVSGLGYCEFPQVSPDGKTLVFNVVHDYTTSQVMVVPSKGGKVRALDSGERIKPENVADYLAGHEGHIVEQASWARDGKTLFFRSNEQGTFGIGQHNMADGGRQMLVHNPELNMKHPIQMPDGRIVCYGGPPSQKYPTVDQYSNLFIADPSSGAITMLTDSTGDFAYKHPAVLGDAVIAHKEDKQAGGMADLIRLDPTTHEQVKITETPTADERHPFYSPSMDLLVYHRKEAGDKNLVLSTPDGSRTAQLTFYGHPAQSPCWSPDGKKIYFVKKDVKQAEGEPFYARQSEIRVMDVEKALKDLKKQAKDQLKKLEAEGAKPELVELARQQHDNYSYFLRRYD
ncbi:MAG: PD40 domain-containing protein [Candidatus Eremiobacteraeota bacterium]|nr:PD40 domain-containing protein [Candidatus Eremiobacteraeota bacterium]